MDENSAILLRVVLAFVLALVGGAISVVVGVSHQRLCGLISLAAGTLLGVTVFAILPECAESMHWWELALALASGYGAFFLISKYVYHVCPACAASHFDEATTHRFSEIAGALVIALGVHSTMDGIALVAGHEGHRQTDLSMLLAICVHKVPEGLALGALLLGAGYKRSRAVVWVALVESTTLLGGVLGVVALPHMSPFWLNAVLAHAGGGFLFLATHAVLGELVKHAKAVVLANFAVGIILIAVLHWAVHTAAH
ncbi:MAG: ZIP family metal transporter [Verrucomicrobiota bacterium]